MVSGVQQTDCTPGERTDVDFQVLGWPADEPRLELDHERFAYAGNFRTGRTGIAVARAESTGDVVAAASFDRDRAVDDAARIRYVTVREDRRGEGVGPTLLSFLVDRLLDREFECVRIGVNNPIAYRACYAAGFAFTGEESAMGELVLQAPSERAPGVESTGCADADAPCQEQAGASETGGAIARDTERYREGLEHFAGRDLPQAQRGVLERHLGGDPPAVDPRES